MNREQIIKLLLNDNWKIQRIDLNDGVEHMSYAKNNIMADIYIVDEFINLAFNRTKPKLPQAINTFNH